MTRLEFEIAIANLVELGRDYQQALRVNDDTLIIIDQIRAHQQRLLVWFDECAERDVP